LYWVDAGTSLRGVIDLSPCADGFTVSNLGARGAATTQRSLTMCRCIAGTPVHAWMPQRLSHVHKYAASIW
jgi:hypothetical protein